VTLYQKVGDDYLPIAESEAKNGLPNGLWLVIVTDGYLDTRELIEPDTAAFVAAAEVARPAMIRAIQEATRARPRDGEPVGKLKRAHEAFMRIAGNQSMWLTQASAWDVAQAGIDAVYAAAKLEVTK
jgi:DNA-binding GntR family transcriptional regulator